MRIADFNPQISLKLHDLPQFKYHPKEYALLPAQKTKVTSKSLTNAFVFSEKDLPGYKARSFAKQDFDENGIPSQGRSFLYEKAKREAKKRESRGRFEPYARRPIPKQTALSGVVTRHLDCTPIKNDEYFHLEK